MISAMVDAAHIQHPGAIERLPGQAKGSSEDFSDLFGNATQAAKPAVPLSAAPAATSTLGDPDVQAWLKSYYGEFHPATAAESEAIPYQPASGAATSYPAGSVYGPDQVYTQALYNQNDYEFATLTGSSPANSMSQLPGIPTNAAQQEYDSLLANENAQRLASGQPIDTAAYWSDPGPVSYMGVTYTSQQLGYCGPGQSSGPEPIFVSQSDQISGTNTYSVPGYTGTVAGIQPNRYYTLQQLEKAGLKSGQPDAQFHPGSWSPATAVQTAAPATSGAILTSDS